MDSYDLFGEDGSGMLEGLTDLGGTDSFPGNTSSAVTSDTREVAESSYRQPYGQGSVPSETSLQKLASYGGTGAGGIASNAQPPPGSGAGPPAEYHDYSAYPPRPRLPQPPHAPHHPPHHTHPSHGYPGYHTGPDPMYSIPEHPAMADMGVWPGAPSSVRGYPPTAPGYRHPYDHQKLHQYPPQQSSAALGLQTIPTGAYMSRQPHFPQPSSQQVYSQQQGYSSYSQIHPPSVPRIGQHAPYHQQMELNSHQYGISHSQQTHSSVPPQHQTHQSMASHQGNIPSQPGLQGHPPVRLHHSGAPSLHHASRQQTLPPSSVAPPTGPQGSYGPPHHTVGMSYQSHTLPHSLDVNIGVANQYGSKLTSLDSGSPQYRAPYPQLSPQMSPRAQMSPRQQAQSQMSPRSSMSPVKGPNASPHHVSRPPAPSSANAGPSTAFNQPNTLQALEQMVLPGNSDYSYQRNPSPAVGHVASPSQWSQTKISTSSNNVIPVDSTEQTSKPVETITSLAMNVDSNKSISTNISLEHDTKLIGLTLSAQGNDPPIDTSKEVINNKPETQSNIFNRPNYEHSSFNEIPKCTIASVGSHINSSDVKSDSEQNKNTSESGLILEKDKPSVQDEQSSQSTEKLLTPVVNEKIQESNNRGLETPKKLSIDNLVPNQGPQIMSNQGPQIANITNAPLLEVTSQPLFVQHNSQLQSVASQLNQTTSLNTGSGIENIQSQAMGSINTSNFSVSNIQSSMANTVNQQNVGANSITKLPPTTSTMQTNQAQTVQSNLQAAMQTISTASSMQNSTITSNSSNVQNLPANLPIAPTSNLPITQATNLLNNASPSIASANAQSVPTTVSTPVTSLPSNITGIANTPTKISNIQTSMQNTTNMSIQTNMPINLPINIQSMHSNISSNQTNLSSNIQHSVNPNMNLMISPNVVPLPNALYQPMTHHQERAALQQQIQEIYCMPPSADLQEKLRKFQERLSTLQQHETNDNCTGGNNCLLPSSLYSSTMVESPQVSSTTGRGRVKGPARPRKPRAKKDKTATVPSKSLDQLPVSEDRVTAGTGLQITNLEMETDLNEEIINLDGSGLLKDGKSKKPRAPRKPRERKPRIPKPPKSEKDEKPFKERKKREPKDPNAPKRKRCPKKDNSEIQADTTTSNEFCEKEEKNNSTAANTDLKVCKTDPTTKLEHTMTEDNAVTDFDDIPVSKIAIKDLLEEAEAKKENENNEDDTDSTNNSPLKKKQPKKRSIGVNKKSSGKKVSIGKKKKRGGIVPESDGEPDDMMSTPPPSPPLEGDCDSSKRRSARHTQRKKYTDDVILRLSDDEYSLITVPKPEKEVSEENKSDINKESVKPDITPKPNYIYVNTTEEDSMIVQHILACRVGKRELKDSTPVIETGNKEDSLEANNQVSNIQPANDTSFQSVNLNVQNNKVQDEKVPSEHMNTDEKEHKNSTPPQLMNTNEYKASEKNDEPDKKPDLEHCKVRIKEDELKNRKPVMVDIEEYFVKYRNFSYLHCEWKTEEELYKGDKRIFSKIKRFKQKQSQQVNIFELFDEEPFNPDYVEVERILDVSETTDPANNTVAKHYLVKWKSLQYEDSTWELEEDVDIDKIKQFELFSAIPPKEKWKFKRRPSADQWTQLEDSPVYKGGNTLRPYQLEGLNWLLFSWHNNRNCILADEMGLGKTIQSLTFVNSVWEYGIRGPFLIIAPLSTIPNWQREFEAWTDMNVIVYHGSQQSKSMIQEYEFYYKNEDGTPIKEIIKFNVLITTFEIIVTDFQDLKNFNWRICVIDEAHRLKNRNCKLLEGLRQLHLEHRVLLSGTPLQNNVNELFSLLNFLEPSQFSSSDAFLTEFGQLKSESEVIKLQALLKPMMLRRLKEDVEKTLAPKEETIIEVELTNIQKKYYRAILERNFSFLCKGTASAANIPNLMNTMMELRKCCIHPYLLNGAEDQIQFDYKQTYGEDNQVYYKALIQSSGKMVLVDKLLPKLKAGGHRVLIFSQMVKCLDILEDYLMYRKYPYERIDGRIRGNLRQEAIDRFSKPDSDRFVFLLCTKAGGLGINLTAADTVIIYDSDWNPQNDLQAQARCHRIGQQKMVKIYRLICRNTYEREMFDKASLKLGLDKAVLQSMNTSQGKETGIRQLSKKEIEDLLRKGAYGAVMDEDNAGDKFCEEDIEMILARRTQVIQMESEKGSTFSKASFAATDQRSDIDIRDPDFWNKWAKKAEIDTTEKREDEDLIVTEPRRRTLIKRYGQDDGTVEMSDMEETPDSDEDLEGIGLRSKKKKDRFGKKSKKYMSDDYIPRHEGVPVDEDVVYGMWARSECFKIERGLLTFGWGRWDEIFDKNQFRRGWTNSVIEDCARVIILYCLRHYKGDEKIRNFIWDLIEPCENGEVTISRNHSGLHNPVPRGRNAKKKNKPKDVPKLNAPQKWEDPNHWSSAEKYDCEAYLESSYKKHLFRHANKVLLRVRMMYYIKHEVIGDYAQKIESGVHASALGMRVPRAVDSAPPRMWWDADCDVSLLVGTYIHGYENYLAMRSDPQLCFVDKLGPPDDAECTDIKSEERSVRSAVGGDEDCTDDVSSGAGATSPAASPRPDDDSTQGSSSGHPWPSMQDLNTRLRRLITAYQRNYKKEELKMQQRAKKMERRERMEQLARDEAAQWRWTRADEEAFRRTVASYGVEFDPTTKSLRWGRFRALARLDTKSDDALTDYLKAFMAMCKRQCGLSVGEAELPTRADLRAEPIGEERAIATLERIDLLRVLREEVAPHPALDARLALCERSPDTPPWWQPARHDKLLVLGVCKHGLGDTYHKLFCDPKLPFADCARKWTENSKSFSRKESQKMSSDEEREIKENLEDSFSDARTLRRSKRNSNNCSQDVLDDDTDALSELETLAKLGRTDESPPPHHWFSERALETRLHHIAHAVQNCEWPTVSKSQRNAEPSTATQVESREERKRAQKQHIAIDVETDRAKLHALLSSPNTVNAHTGRDRASTSRSQSDVLESCAASMSKTSNVNWERDDASSESSSRRSTPAPPPAHQRHTHTPAPAPSPSPSASSSSAAVHSAAPVDLSAPLDLSEAHDFSLGRRTPASELNTATLNPPTLAPPSKGRLDDTLSKLMKRKNVPEPEVIVGKEKKRKKLDEIVLGLSAAKGHFPPSNSATIEPLRNKPTTVLPNVTVTPAALPNSSTASPAQKPFSVTVTSVPSPQATPKELSSFLQQTLEQTSQQKAPKTSSSGVKPYSHEAKVNKWLAEQANVERRRALTPRLSPDEHVPVVHRVTGKRLAGHKAPQLKHLAQWIAENPMYDIDSKWTEGVKEHVKLPQDVRAQRHSPMQPSSSTSERKKGRPPTLDASSASILSSASNFPHLSQSLAGLNPALLASLSGLSAFDPKTLASTLSNLTGFDPKTLNSFDPKLLSSLGSFDPKNNPLLTSFTSMPNMLGNMNSGNLFANLASLGIPGFSGVDMANLGVATSSDTKSKSRKPTDTASSSNKSNPSQFPFVFPNPNMLYPQLGLSGLNPFGMQTGISSAYDALGLLSNSLATSSSATTTHSVSHTAARSSSKATLPRPTSMTSASTSGLSRQPKNTSDRSQASAQLHQLLLPPDTYLLESLSKQNLSYDPLKPDKRTREPENHDVVAADLSSKSDKKKMPFEAPRAQLPLEFAAVQEKLLKGDKRDLDISKMLFEQMASGALSASLVSSSEAKKLKENEGKGAFEKLNKTSAEYISRSLVSDDCMSGISMAHKRTHDEITNEPENLVIQPLDSSVMKKLKENEESDSAVALNNIEKQTDTHTHSGEMDLEDLIAPSTVIKTGLKSNNEVDKTQNVLKSQAVPPEREQKSVSPTTNLEDEQQPSKNDDLNSTNDSEQKKGDYKELTQESIDDTNVSSEEISEINDGGRRTSKKKARKSTDDNPGGGARRELRSSAGRQAAAAAARHALNH